jgi:hypothetical protein
MQHLCERGRTLIVSGVALSVVVAVLSFGAGAGAAVAGSSGLATFRMGGFETRYPAGWSVVQPSLQATMGFVYGYFSNQRLQDPCATVDDGQGRISQRCGSPLAALAPGGVLVSWSSPGVPMTAQGLASWLDTQPGTAIVVDGVPGKLAVRPAGPGDCSGLGASRVVIANLLQDSEWRFSMEACLRGPKLAQHEAQVRAMLRSTRFPPKTDATRPPGDAHVVDRVMILDDYRLAVGGGCPKLPPQVDVSETSSAVRLRVRYTDTPFACLKYTTVTLAAPLGQRQIVDMTTGQAIPVDDRRSGVQLNPSAG